MYPDTENLGEAWNFAACEGRIELAHTWYIIVCHKLHLASSPCQTMKNSVLLVSQATPAGKSDGGTMDVTSNQRGNLSSELKKLYQEQVRHALPGVWGQDTRDG